MKHPAGIPSVLTVDGVTRCYCPKCHNGRAPLLTDHVEAAFCCDDCRLLHYEAAAIESNSDRQVSKRRNGGRR